MRGAFIVNKYYSDNGIEYVANRLSEEFARLGHTLDVAPCPMLFYDDECSLKVGGGFDFIIFWNKDYQVAEALEKTGARVFNSAQAICDCDDKAKTYLRLSGEGVKVPKTVVAPLVYDITTQNDLNFITQVENYLGYPIVIKENTGSQGRQVYLAENRSELIAIHSNLLHTPHVFQSYVADERGVDIRVYVIGGKAIASCKRRNTTGFKSNVHMGGRAEQYDAPQSLLSEAERIATILGLDYGSIDFLTGDEPVFVEANSNAYIYAIESLGYNIAGAYAEHIIRTLEQEKCAKK